MDSVVNITCSAHCAVECFEKYPMHLSKPEKRSLFLLQAIFLGEFFLASNFAHSLQSITATVFTAPISIISF